MANFKDVEDAFRVMGEIYGKSISDAAGKMMAADLSAYAPDVILTALQSCRRELRYFPNVADIVARIQASDGRPGREEAWSLIPKDEFNSCVWTIEMATAYGAAHPHIRDRDFVAARMAFLEIYDREMKAARAVGVTPTWSACLGYDKSTHEGVLSEAVRKNQITLEYAQRLAPMLNAPKGIHPDVLSHVKRATLELPGGL